MLGRVPVQRVRLLLSHTAIISRRMSGRQGYSSHNMPNSQGQATSTPRTSTGNPNNGVRVRLVISRDDRGMGLV